MLIEYNFENYTSFKDKNTFSMLGVKSFKEHEPNNIIENGSSKLLKSAAIYGNNASGKSNLVKGMQVMKEFVRHSFRDALLEEDNLKVKIDSFLLNHTSENNPSSFEIVFIQKGTKYRYGFKIQDKIILKEWLYQTTSKEVPLFKRNKNSFDINKSSFKEGVGLESKTKSTVLFLSLIAQFNGEISNNIIDWFSKFSFISGLQDTAYASYTINRLHNDDNFKKWISLIVQSLEISNITTEEIESNENKLKKVSTWHKKFDKDNLLVDTVPFDFINQESEGTKKFIHLLGPWYDTLKNGSVLIVDELDSRLHTQLTKKLIELFHIYNRNNAQLIFTSHDVSLLEKELLRRDQIWFTDKDQFGVSDLYSLADFKTKDVRNTSSYEKNYLLGKYGAVSTLEFNDRLIELLYNE